MPKQTVKRMAIVRIATEDSKGEVIFGSEELSEAVKYVEAKNENLPPGYRFDIYYRYEENTI